MNRELVAAGSAAAVLGLARARLQEARNALWGVRPPGSGFEGSGFRVQAVLRTSGLSEHLMAEETVKA